MKRMMFIVLIAVLAISCAKKQKAMNCEMVTMSKMEAPPPVLKSSAHFESDKVVLHDEKVAEGNDYLAVPSNKSSAIKVTPEVIKKKIIKDGRMGLQVKELQAAKKRIDTLLTKLGGYYAKENLRNSGNESGYELSVRIPADNFEKFMTATGEGDFRVLYKEISARDVTEEFVDLNTRLNSKRTALARYNDIMKRADKVKDIVEIEEAVRNLQEEIESSEGHLRYLNDCVNYSTLELSVSTEKDFKYHPARRDSFWEKFKESVVEGWFGLVDFVLGLFLLWPLWIVLTALIILIVRWIKRRRARKQKE